MSEKDPKTTDIQPAGKELEVSREVTPQIGDLIHYRDRLEGDDELMPERHIFIVHGIVQDRLIVECKADFDRKLKEIRNSIRSRLEQTQTELDSDVFEKEALETYSEENVGKITKHIKIGDLKKIEDSDAYQWETTECPARYPSFDESSIEASEYYNTDITYEQQEIYAPFAQPIQEVYKLLTDFTDFLASEERQKLNKEIWKAIKSKNMTKLLEGIEAFGQAKCDIQDDFGQLVDKYCAKRVDFVIKYIQQWPHEFGWPDYSNEADYESGEYPTEINRDIESSYMIKTGKYSNSLNVKFRGDGLKEGQTLMKQTDIFTIRARFQEEKSKKLTLQKLVRRVASTFSKNIELEIEINEQLPYLHNGKVEVVVKKNFMPIATYEVNIVNGKGVITIPKPLITDELSFNVSLDKKDFARGKVVNEDEGLELK